MAELVMSAAEIAADPGKWLEARREGITATDVPTILGLNPWDSPFALWHRKAGNLHWVPPSERDYLMAAKRKDNDSDSTTV